MKITLKRKPGAPQNMIIMVEHPEDQAREDKTMPGKHAKLVAQVTFGGLFDTATGFKVLDPATELDKNVFKKEQAEQLAYHIMSKYPGMFVPGEPAVEGKAAVAPANKSASGMSADK